MTRKVFRYIAIVAVFVFLASSFLTMGVLYSYFTKLQTTQMKEHAALISRGIELNGEKYFDDLTSEEYRITWMAADGTVKYDNQISVDKLDNHLQREEIRDALKTGEGESTRYSTTLMEKMFYVAQRLDDGSILRLADSQQSILGLLLGMLQPLLIIAVVALVLSVILAYRLSKRIIQPINELNLDEPSGDGMYEELKPFLNRIRDQKRQIRIQEETLRQKKEEFEAVTKNLPEGMLLMDSEGKILSLNKAAAEFLGIGSRSVGANISGQREAQELIPFIEHALAGSQEETVIHTGKGEYQAMVSPVLSGQQVTGVTILILDMSEKKKAEIIRREFTANVSHELKTPLQTISGNAELLSEGYVQPERVPEFAQKIYDESQRMIALVEDIIELSQLDEGGASLQKEEVDLYAIAEMTVSNLSQAAEQAEVTFDVEGSSVLMAGIPQLLESMTYNLCDNAIKYNRPGGSVRVRVSSDGSNACLSVADDGIGIPKEHQERIFERFYRVDKSHSREVGGTGLGLSLVKHAVKAHGGTIQLYSALDQGTEIVVTLPCARNTLH
ncbi:MAG: PAS domain S-box protein [Clostridia bacterium]|nr:PAS domain S-box protein [Clostridia bacterium]